jgi:hypothetical protein
MHAAALPFVPPLQPQLHRRSSKPRHGRRRGGAAPRGLAGEPSRRRGGRAAPVVGGGRPGVGLPGPAAHGAGPQSAGPEGHPVPLPLGRPQGGAPADGGGPGQARAHGPAPRRPPARLPSPPPCRRGAWYVRTGKPQFDFDRSESEVTRTVVAHPCVFEPDDPS